MVFFSYSLYYYCQYKEEFKHMSWTRVKLQEKAIKHQTQPLPSFKSYRLKQLIRKYDIQFVYGHREILLKYANLDETSLLTGIIQHGVGPTFTLSSDWPTPRASFFRRSPLWVYSREVAKELSSKGVRNVTSIGSPWLYSKILDSYNISSEKNRLKYLIFPQHHPYSAARNTLEICHSKIRYWRSITDSADLEICLFWSEFIDPIWQTVARQENISLKCAGRPNSSLANSFGWSQSDARVHYYRNLREIMAPVTHCIFESFTSAMFYASDLGKNVGFFPADSRVEVEPRPRHVEKEHLWLTKNIPKILNTCGESTTLTAITYELLGYDDLLSSIGLSEVLSYKAGIIPESFI